MKFYPSKILNSFSSLTHAFTLSQSGNLAFHVDDDEKNVLANHELLAKALGYKKESLVHMKQIHSENVHIVNDETFETPPVCDALITNKTNTPLMVMVADCSPVLVYDDEKKVIAAVHAGRAGAFKNILKKVIETMQREFGSNPKNIYVSVGASIGVCCYEVGNEIYDEAKELGVEYAIEQRDSRHYLDINKILRDQLLACGIDERNIEFSNECTSCNTHRYFSYRAQKKTGRFAGVLMLR